jgi:hypothetical protein
LSGDSGYFASLNAFESLLVRDSRLVRAGDPDGSELVKLLEGRRTGSSLTQMPISGDPFAVRSERGETGVTIDEIRDWISELEVPGLSREPDPSVATVQRIGATHVELGLRDLLGLTMEDFFQPAESHGIAEIRHFTLDSYYVRSPDRTPTEFYARDFRFMALGGSTAVLQQHEDRSISTTFIQHMVPLSQAWCDLAVNKAENTTLFAAATPTTGTGDINALRAQIKDWHLIFLGKIATDADVDLVVDTVFAPHEAASNPKAAWISTCSYFIRHPLFIFY